MRHIANRVSVILGLLIVVAYPSYATTEAKEKDIKTLMAIMTIPSATTQIADSMVSIAIASEKKRYPNMPKNVEYALSKAIHDVVIEQAPELENLTASLYDKYYTHDEIKQLIAFFNTPVGRKYSSVVTPMAQDIMPIAQAWGNKVGPLAAKRAAQELKKYGYK